MAKEAVTVTRETLNHLPFVGLTRPITELTAQRVRAVMKKLNPNITDVLDTQIEDVGSSIAAELAVDDAGNFVLTPLQLRGVIAQSAIRGATQVLLDTAGSLEIAETLDRHLLTPSTETA